MEALAARCGPRAFASQAAFTASFAARNHKELHEWRERWATPERAAERRRRVWEELRRYDLLGTTDQFYESVLVVARALNWSVRDVAAPEFLQQEAPTPADSCQVGAVVRAKRPGGRPPPWWCRNPLRDHREEKRRVHAHVCPNMSVCDELIRAVAPLDFELYAYAQRQLREAIHSAGPAFSEQLADMRQASEGACVQCTACSWRPQRPYRRLPVDSEKHGRRSIFALAPNFSKPRACIRGNQRVMEVIWSEHVKGGRSKPYEHLQELVKVKPKVKPTELLPGLRPGTSSGGTAHTSAQLTLRRRNGADQISRRAPVAHASGRGRQGRARRHDSEPLTSRGRNQIKKNERQWKRRWMWSAQNLTGSGAAQRRNLRN
eukprot:Transcript_5770.p1 GENE.Transcript_5770~~Transcript_5770.p1  ORF type:complete len:376 (+),score=40.81 Transcript_5770:839-1966(+)